MLLKNNILPKWVKNFVFVYNTTTMPIICCWGFITKLKMRVPLCFAIQARFDKILLNEMGPGLQINQEHHSHLVLRQWHGCLFWYWFSSNSFVLAIPKINEEIRQPEKQNAEGGHHWHASLPGKRLHLEKISLCAKCTFVWKNTLLILLCQMSLPSKT